MRTLYHSLLTFALISITSNFLHAQGTQVDFGKNRVQYHDDFDEWFYYESQNFVTYWYGKSRMVGQAVVQMAEIDFEDIQGLLEHRINDKTEVIVYADLTDLKQSNIGTEETFINTGGQTKIVGNKIFVYFNGDHTHLRKQIREGVATVYLNAMLFGSNLQEIVQNAVLLNLPDWFKDGLVSYVGESWNTEIDDDMRRYMKNERYQDFEKFSEDFPKLAGHSMWHYLAETFGKSTVSNLLYLTRINRSIDSGLLYVLGSSYDKLIDNWSNYYQGRYSNEDAGLWVAADSNRVAFKNKRQARISNTSLSPDGKKLVYVLNEIGKLKVYLHDLETGERKKILKHGFRNPFQATDYNYPHFAWNPNNQELVILYERRDIVKYMAYDIATGTSIVEDLDPQIQRVYSIDFINPGKVLMSAEIRGQSDLFIYRPSVRQTERITNDFYDDLDAKVVNLRGKKGVIFSSNRSDTLLMTQRLDTILPLNTFDLFYYDLDTRGPAAVRLTNTPLANETKPIAIDSTYFGYLSDQSGIVNRYSGQLTEVYHYDERIVILKDSTVLRQPVDSTFFADLDSTFIDTIFTQPRKLTVGAVHASTNYGQRIYHQHTAPKANRGVEILMGEKALEIFTFTPDPITVVEPWLTPYQRIKLDRFGLLNSLSQNIPSKSTEVTKPKKEIVIAETDLDLDIEEGKLFQSEFSDPPSAKRKEPEVIAETLETNSIVIKEPKKDQLPGTYSQSEILGQKFNPSRIVSNRLKFKTDLLTTTMDNSLLFGGLDNFAAEPQMSSNSGGTTNQQQNNNTGYQQRPMGILLKANIKDLFEDYIMEGGIRIPTRFNGAEYFIFFDDKKKRLDKRYAFYRRNQRIKDQVNPISRILERREIATNIAQYQLRYPLDIFRSVRGIATLRNDKETRLATDDLNFVIPTTRAQRLGLRLEYVFDNTLDVATNIKNGTRYKVYAEAVKKVEIDIIDSWKLSLDDGWMGIFGFDARHYQRLDKRSILAARIAGATSFGSERMLYYLGGVDNWMFARFNNSIPFPTSGNIAFQTLATNLRGFSQNIRNGNSFALANFELRVPFLNYFFKRLQSPFLKNMQVVGFFDVGTAWEGISPFDEESPINSATIAPPNTPVVINVNYFRDPIVAGYGAGLRTTLFGYFVRLDWAYGIETREVQDRIIHFSLGLDF